MLSHVYTQITIKLRSLLQIPTLFDFTPITLSLRSITKQKFLSQKSFSFAWCNSPPPPPSGPRPPHYRDMTITLRHATLGRTPLDEWSAQRREHYLKTHNLTTDRHTCPGGFRKRFPSKRAPADPQFRPRGHWDRSGHTYHTYGILFIGSTFYVPEILPAETVRKDMITEKLLEIPYSYSSTNPRRSI
jgi:hypothetical protein